MENKIVSITKGSEGISYDVDWNVMVEFAECPHTKLSYTGDFPKLFVGFEKNRFTNALKYLLRLQGLETKPLDFICQIDADFSNLTLNNTVVIRSGTPEWREVKSWLMNNKFDKHPYDGVYWHLWTGRWTAYSPFKTLIGLFDTADEARQAIRNFEYWWNTGNG